MRYYDYEVGYAEGCRDQRLYQNRRYNDMVRTKDGAIKIIADALAARARELEEATAVNAALQAALDEANAKIEDLTNPNPIIPGTNYRVGDKVHFKNRRFNQSTFLVMEAKLRENGQYMVLLERDSANIAPGWACSVGWFEKVES